MKTKTHDPNLAIVAARAVLADAETVGDPAVLRAAGEAMFYTATVGEEREILRGMLKAARACGSEGAVAALLRALGEMEAGRIMVDPNDALAIVGLLKDCDGTVRGEDAEALGRAAYETATDGHHRNLVSGIFDAAGRNGDVTTTAAAKAALAVYDGKDRRAEELELLGRLKDVILREGATAAVLVLDEAAAKLRGEG